MSIIRTLIRFYNLVWCGNCGQQYDKDSNPDSCPYCGYTDN